MKPTPEHGEGSASEPHDAAAPVNATVSYETQDVSVGAIERAGVILAVVVLVSLAIVAGTFYLYTSVQPLGTPEIAPGMRAAGRELPPAPRMQGIPGDTLPPPEQQRQFQAAAAAELNGYGWMDAQHSVAHIPIEEAMKILAAQGLPQPAEPGKTAPAAAAGKKGP
ncbi:MAG: hypothetical protein ACLP1Y_05855 [Candidatus Acidiferrales bacterium]